MKSKKSILAVMFVLMVGASVFYSCKKSHELVARYDHSVSAADMRSIIELWHQRFERTASQKSKTKANGIIEQINYVNSFKVNTWDNSELYFAQVGAGTEKTTDFIAFKRIGTRYAIDGIYSAPSMNTLAEFLSTKQLPAGQTINVHTTDGIPLKGWQSTAEGKLLTKTGIGKLKNQPQRSVNSTNGGAELYLYDTGGNGELCIDWYYTIWDTDTGAIIFEEYQFSTGDCGPNHEIPTATPSDCYDQAIQHEAALTGTQVSEDDEEIITLMGDSAKVLRRWQVVDGTTYHYFSKEIGVTEKPDPAYNIWQWRKLDHLAIERTGISPGGTCTLNTAGVVAIPTITANRLYASMHLDFTVTYQAELLDCGSVKIAFPAYDISYDPTSPQWLAKGQ